MNQQVMRIKTYLFAKVLGLIICTSVAFIAQGQYAITNPKLQDDGSRLIIEYQIFKNQPGDKFLIELIITDDDGNIVDASSFSGDIGQHVTGGNKSIIWEYLKDDVIYETTVTVKVKHEKQDKKTELPQAMYMPSTKSYTRTGLILQSLALPGLGMTKLKEKTYWQYGVVGYGLIGTSIYFFLKANSFYYDTYDNDRTAEKYDQYLDYRTTALITAGGAAAIWLTDLVLISVLSKNMNQYGNSKIQVAPCYNFRTRSPMLSMTYRF